MFLAPGKIPIQDLTYDSGRSLVLPQHAHPLPHNPPLQLASAPIPTISQQTLGSLSTGAYAGICLMICPTDSNVLFLIVIFSSQGVACKKSLVLKV
jgi:hypothetical protein